jgi:hypothetical protein
MYDTIKFWLGAEGAGDFAPACLNALSGVTQHKREAGTSYSGNLENITVYVSDTGVSLRGSLAKFYLGDNIQTLTRGDVKIAIELLSDMLHLPMANAKVNQIDFAQNLIMKYKPGAYYPLLGECRHYNRLEQPESLYYNNTLRNKLFYNKVAEMKKKRITIPAPVAKQNILRYELRYISRLNKQFKSDVRACHLSDEKFYMNLVNQWVMEYENIHKNNLINLNHKKMNSPKDFWEQGKLHWIKMIGQDHALRLVDDLRAMNAFDKPEYYSRLKREIRDRCSRPGISETSELIAELNEKINRVKINYR